MQPSNNSDVVGLAAAGDCRQEQCSACALERNKQKTELDGTELWNPMGSLLASVYLPVWQKVIESRQLTRGKKMLPQRTPPGDGKGVKVQDLVPTATSLKKLLCNDLHKAR